MRLVKDVDGRNGSPFGLAHAATIAVAAVLTAVVMALLLPSSVFAAPETPPTAVGSIPDQEVVQGGVITVDVEEFFNDPDGPDDTLVYTAASSVETVATVAVTDNVVTITVLAAAAVSATTTITVTATDTGTNAVTQEFDVMVVDNTPTTAEGAIPRQTIPDGEAARDVTRTVNVARYFSDEDAADRGDTLVYTATSADTAVATVAVTDNVVTITAAGPGIAIITVTALDLAANAVGDDDNTGVTQSIIARVTANMAPTAEGSIPSQEVIQGGSVELDIAKYFNDPDGNNTLVYTAASSVETVATVAVTDNVVTITVLDTAETGAKTTITVTADDDIVDDADRPTQTFEVTVRNNTVPSKVGSIPDRTVIQGGKIEIDVARYFSDPDTADRGDTLVYTATSADTAVATVGVGVTEDDSSVVTVTVVDAATVGAKPTITVTATDSKSSTAAQTFEVTVLDNTSPTVKESVPDRTVVVGRSIEVDLSKYFSDEDAADRGDTLIYTATSSAVSVATVGTPDDNSVVTITAAATGVAIITVTATDSSDVAASQAFVLRVVANTPPSSGGGDSRPDSGRGRERDGGRCRRLQRPRCRWWWRHVDLHGAVLG